MNLYFGPLLLYSWLLLAWQLMCFPRALFKLQFGPVKDYTGLGMHQYQVLSRVLVKKKMLPITILCGTICVHAKCMGANPTANNCMPFKRECNVIPVRNVCDFLSPPPPPFEPSPSSIDSMDYRDSNWAASSYGRRWPIRSGLACTVRKVEKAAGFQIPRSVKRLCRSPAVRNLVQHGTG